MNRISLIRFHLYGHISVSIIGINLPSRLKQPLEPPSSQLPKSRQLDLYSVSYHPGFTTGAHFYQPIPLIRFLQHPKPQLPKNRQLASFANAESSLLLGPPAVSSSFFPIFHQPRTAVKSSVSPATKQPAAYIHSSILLGPPTVSSLFLPSFPTSLEKPSESRSRQLPQTL